MTHSITASIQAPKKNDIIYPEMGETTDATIEYRVSYVGGFRVTTDEELKGRGIKLLGDGTNHKRGKKTYQVTELAMDKLQEKYDTCHISLL